MTTAVPWYKNPSTISVGGIRSVGDLDVRGTARRLWNEIMERIRLGQRWKDIVDKRWANILGVSVSTFYRALARLKSVGWIATALMNGRRFVRLEIALAGSRLDETPRQELPAATPKAEIPKRQPQAVQPSPVAEPAIRGFVRKGIAKAMEEGVTLKLDESGMVCAVANRPGGELSEESWQFVRAFESTIATELGRSLPQRE